MVDVDPGKAKEVKQGSSGGGYVAGDRITVGDILKSAVAIGEGATAILNYYEQPQENLAVWSGVPPKPPYLFGRDALVGDLIAKLLHGPGQAVAVHGLPGVGKTSLAVALANQKEVLAHFKDGVLWASLGPQAREEDIAAILNRWAEALGGDISSQIDLAARKTAVSEAIGQHALLIVIDDAWDEDIARHLRFSNPNCRLLLTTRDQDVAAGFLRPGEEGIALPSLEEQTSLQLLRALAPEAHDADPAAFAALARAAGGLPLALELLGGYLAAPRHKLRPQLSKKALAELQDPRRRLSLAQERLGQSARQETLQEAISLSIEALLDLENGAQLQQAFYDLGAFAPKPQRFSWEAAEAVTGLAIEDLVLRSLVEISGDQLAMHQVMSDVARSQTSESAITRHRDFYQQAVNENWQDWRSIEQIYGQIKRAWEAAPREAELLNLIWALNIYQERRGLWQDRLAWSQRGLEVAQEQGWREDEGTLLNNLGAVYFELGQPQKAFDHYNQALAIAEETGNKGGQAAALNNLGALYARAGQLEKALAQYNQALAVAGDENLLHNIGRIYARLGQQEKALEYYQRDLAFRREIGDRAGQAAALNSIGTIYSDAGQFDFALEQLQEALVLSEEEGDRSGVANTLHNIGVAQIQQGRPADALEYAGRSLSISEEVHHLTGQANTLNVIGWAYSDLGQADDALAAYNKALPIWDKIGDRQGVAITLSRIGALYDDVGQPQEALAFYDQARTIYEETGDRSALAGNLLSTGMLFGRLGQPDQALARYKEALPLFEETDNRPMQAAVLHNIGAVYATDFNRWEEALAYYDQALRVSEGTEHRSGTANILNKKGVAHAVLGQWDEALEHYNRALPIWQALEERNKEASTLYNIGIVYANTDQPQKALEQYSQALAISQETGDRAGQAETLTIMGDLYAEIGRPDKALVALKEALAITEEAQQRPWQATLLHQIGLMYHRQGREEEALAYYTRALPLLDEASDWGGLADTMFKMALILINLESLEQAAALLRQVLEFDRMSHHPDMDAHNQLLAQVEGQLRALGKE